MITRGRYYGIVFAKKTGLEKKWLQHDCSHCEDPVMLNSLLTHVAVLNSLILHPSGKYFPIVMFGAAWPKAVSDGGSAAVLHGLLTLACAIARAPYFCTEAVLHNLLAHFENSQVVLMCDLQC